MRQLYRNISFTGISQILYTAMAFLLVPFVARYLKSDGYGIYNLAGILGFFFNLFSDLGLSTFLTIEVSKNRNIAAKLFAAVLGTKIFLVLPAGLIVLSYLKLSNLEGTIVHAVLIFTFSAIFAGFSNAFFAVFRGFQKMEFETLATVIDKGISVALGIFLLVKGFGIHTFLLSFVAAEICKFILCLLLLHQKFFPISISLRYKQNKLFLARGLPFGLSVFLAVCYNYTAILLLSSLSSMSQVGLYSAGFKFLNLATILPTVLATAFLPQLAENIKDNQRSSLLFAEGLKFLLFFSIPMIPFVFHFSQFFITLIFGKDFTEAAVFLKILVWGAFAQMTNIYMVSLYSAAGKQKMIVYFQTAALAANLVMNFFLIRSFQALGASAATVITEWLIFLAALFYAFFYLLDYRLIYRQLAFYVLKIAVASCIMYGLGRLLYPHHLSALPAMAACALTFLVIVQITGAMGWKSLLFFIRKSNQKE
ncbi:MAG: flippase [candidate division KSB1 bacterium]|nr:flippase [candidate division KSB1 bacterium]